MNVKQGASPNAQREIGDIDLGILSHEHQFSGAILRHKTISNERLLMTITGVLGTGESTVVKRLTKVVNQAMGNENDILRMGTTGTSVFATSGATYHSILNLPVNHPFIILSGQGIFQLQENLWIVKVIIIDEVSMIGKKKLYFIDQRLQQGSGKVDESFGGFGIIFVGDSQKLPPIGDTLIYDEDASDSYILYSDSQDFVVLQKSQQQQGDDTLQGSFRRILSHCT